MKVTTLSQRDIIEKLDGKEASATVQEVTFEPGQEDSTHRHAGPVWIYHAAPWVLAEAGYEAREIAPITHEGEMLRCLAVRFPDGVHSHTASSASISARTACCGSHDYEVDVWADTPAAHFVSDYVDVNGLKYPTRRSVFARRPDGTPDLDLNAVTIALSDYTLF